MKELWVVAVGLMGDLVNSGGSRVTATRTLNLGGVNSIAARPSGTRAGNGMTGVVRLMRIDRTWTEEYRLVGLRRLSPIRNSGGSSGEVNENRNSN